MGMGVHMRRFVVLTVFFCLLAPFAPAAQRDAREFSHVQHHERPGTVQAPEAGRLIVGPVDGSERSEAEPSIARVWMEQLLDAIRLDTPRPTVHARNLFHLSAAMWDAWAAYDKEARRFLGGPKFLAPDDTAETIRAAREETLSYAAYRLLAHRFVVGPGTDATQAAIRDQMLALGYDPDFDETVGTSAAARGNRIAARMIRYGHSDGSNEPQDYRDYTGYFAYNLPLVLQFPGTNMLFPNRWQPLAFDYLILQNGIVIGAAVQEFIGPYWGRVRPFALTDDDMGPEWVYLDPGMPPQLNGEGDEEFRQAVVEVIRYSSLQDPTLDDWRDIGPAGNHNNTLGENDGSGYPVNPYTGQPYAENVVPHGDYGRVLAEYWADGPHSETPPGHWNVIFHEVSDSRLLQKRIGGEGPIVDDLEWDVKAYLPLNGAMHDAAVAAWGAKGHYDYSRPISHIRHQAGLGQSSDPAGPSYHPDGIRLEPGLIEVITAETIAPGERHEHLAGEDDENVGAIAIYSWRGPPEDQANDTGGVGWILGEAWFPYQQTTFVTPAFAAYVSGHSTFSRAGAEVMTALTGDKYFPGGMASALFPAGNFLHFENGPSVDVWLQWATYYDAADEAGISRLYGGIHVPADDGPGRIMGSVIGKRSWQKVGEYYDRPMRPIEGDPSGPGDGLGEVELTPLPAAERPTVTSPLAGGTVQRR